MYLSKFHLLHRPSVKKQKKRISSWVGEVAVLPPQRKAQNEMILRTLHESLEKFKITVQLPVILRNPVTVLESVKGTEYEPCARLLMEYLHNCDRNIKYHKDSLHEYDGKLIALIEMFQKNYKIRNMLPNWNKEGSLFDNSVMEAFDLLEQIVEQRISRPAHNELQKEKEMHTIFQKNAVLRKEIDTVRRSIQLHKKRTRWQRIVPPNDVVKAKNEVESKDNKRKSYLRAAIEKNVQDIKHSQQNFDMKYGHLEIELILIKNNFLQVKKDGKEELNRLRLKKKKWAAQLQGVIDIYDETMTEKFKEKIYLEDEYAKKKNEMDIFMKQYNAVKDEYANVLNNKEKQWQAKANRFFRTRAARIIQRYWRRYLEKKQDGSSHTVQKRHSEARRRKSKKF